MNVCIGQNDSSLCGILNGILRLSRDPRYPSNGSGQMFATQTLDILDLERVNEQLIQSQQGDRITNLETQHERTNIIGTFLQGIGDAGFSGGLEFHTSFLRVHANLDLHVLNDGRIQLHPMALQWGVSMWWYIDSNILLHAFIDLLGGQCGILRHGQPQCGSIALSGIGEGRQRGSGGRYLLCLHHLCIIFHGS